MYSKNALLEALSKEETLLSRLDSEREKVIARLNVLKQQLTNLEKANAESPIACAPKTPQEKVALFRSLFRGREDIFPKLWINRAGKKGYSPACTNDWVSNNRSDVSDKIRLFMSLFKGRDDVFARRWENKKKGTSGYSPCCLNEWQQGLCSKPKGKCSDCRHTKSTVRHAWHTKKIGLQRML
ncbi:MAG TPA: hypothetical protein VL122_02450 [Nitrospirota bacterium]|nr:hypothetical protein [Nitrospirota bacterium]